MFWRNLKVQLHTTFERWELSGHLYRENDLTVTSGSMDSLYFCEFSLVQYLDGTFAIFAIKSLVPLLFLPPLVPTQERLTRPYPDSAVPVVGWIPP